MDEIEDFILDRKNCLTTDTFVQQLALKLDKKDV